MANFTGHISTSGTLGLAYGFWGATHLQMDWGPVCLGAGLTTLGGLLPDLDSDSGIPVREMFNLAGALVPVLLLPRLHLYGLTNDQILAVMAGLYVVIRFGLSEVFKRMTAHRGMFHSVPGLAIAGLAVFLLYHNPDVNLRAFMAGGTMIGFLSHLVLDELFAVDLMGVTPRLNQFAGSALKFWSKSRMATLGTYAVLSALAIPAWTIWEARPTETVVVPQKK
jgi:membrane-bound metal-dependent hydrolase YbcI (DUF457 family)